MEENTIPSGADDKTKPQEIETQQAGDQESSEQVESKENEVQESASEQIPDKVDEPIEVEAVEKRNEISKEINISELSIDALVDLLSNVTTRDDWFKNHKQIQSINSVFEEKFQADLEINKQSFIKEGGNEIDFYFKPEYKKKFDQIGYDYREKRRNHYKSQEATQKVNLEKKKAIIEEIKNLINIEQNINTIYNSFRALQESWYNTGPIPRADNQNIWETYKHHVERFYDFLHLNRELRDLDFKHNYEEKLKIIEQAEALQQVPDIVRASRDLNTLHQLWKNDLGPVAKEHSEDLWNRFQEASRVIQSKRQTYQKDMVGAMKENLEKKETLLKEMKSLTESPLDTHKAWQNAINKYNKLREDFKTIGYVPAKESKATWQEFRDIGREFMRLKNVFYKEQKKEYNQNIDGKKALIEKSKAIVESETWESRVQEMKDLQKEWRGVGFVPRKLDNKLWDEFSEVQKIFFDRLKTGFQHLSSEQEAMQKEKLAQIDKLKTFTFSSDIKVLKEEYNNFWDTWKAISRLDTGNQEKINYSFSNALLAGVKKVELDKDAKNEVLINLNALILQGDSKRLQQELQTARTNVSTLKAELTQLENNLAFFSNSSSENPLFKNVEKQIKSCQNKIDKATEDHIRLKQIRNSQEKSAKKAAENVEQDNEESSEEN
ncbi:DUF349 domain-containing protein [Flavobacteriaceae bacterium]|mgnify:FL=1|jgi:hypothetical protein|nr:DUF349 domain-containing protein [Flavobacteriaceae bacterium]MDA7820530.1 DUF349 domain-containing protein [Flavobacteriaceae bacterium]MDA9327131.1 DUF349 domain-containing protein [Flavobacteriaceae bacterium]MDB2695322.1 DUF349 domain-containing protein [Flavobacteriaceae bacterium]MDC0485385.1 DUF349 domain-containing protein [Flavobacteriaceae bacterium]